MARNANDSTDQTANAEPAARTVVLAPPPAEPDMPEFERMIRNLEWWRRELYIVSLDLYRAIDATPDDQPVDRNVAEAYQQVNRAILACDDARRALFTAAANNGIDTQRF